MMVKFTAIRYLYLIRKNLPCSGGEKRRIMGQVKQNVMNYIKENPSSDLETLMQRIGSPQNIAAAYLEEQETGKILTSLRSGRKWIVAAFALAVILTYVLFGDAIRQAYLNTKIDEDVKAVLNATMNTPNTDLHDPGAVLALGVGQTMTAEEKAAIEQHYEELNRNWEELLGQYFSPGSFDLFLNSYIRSRFFADDPVPSELLDVDMVSVDENREVLEVQVKVGYRVQTFEVIIMRNPDGLLYRVEITEKN